MSTTADIFLSGSRHARVAGIQPLTAYNQKLDPRLREHDDSLFKNYFEYLTQKLQTPKKQKGQQS